MQEPGRFTRIEDSVDALIARVGKKLVVAMPLGIGKPNPWINALYHRAKADPEIDLWIITALSLDRPHGRSLIERRFLGPFAERVFGNYPNMDYAEDDRRGRLPPNVRVSEFFLKTSAYIGNASVQRNYIYSNYTHAVRDALTLGVNVYAQALAVEQTPEGPRYSLSCNSDLTRDAIEMSREMGNPLVQVGVVNRELPFMPNDAVIEPELVDILVDDPAGTHTMFGTPNMRVDDQDYGISLWTSTTVRDAGMLQIGIGSLGDGIAQALITRDQDNASYRAMIEALAPGRTPAWAQLDPFKEGLYGCSEMFVNGFMALIDAGVVRREVFDHEGLQKLLNAHRITSTPDAALLAALAEDKVVSSPLNDADFAMLRHFGILKDEVSFAGGVLTLGDQSVPARLDDPAVSSALSEGWLGTKLKHGRLIHAGFFIGPNAFYQRLRDLPRELLDKIDMTRISFVNDTFGHEGIAVAQRQHARFINTSMMATLLGAAVSDALESGDLVSGVGGQYNFVAQGQTLPGARSVMMLRAWRTNSAGKPISNIVWSYGHVTIPRHLRDIFVTEYGVADVRGQPEGEVVKRMLAIADSRFQDELLAKAKKQGKVEPDYEIPAEQRQNLPEVLEARLAAFRASGKLPDFPFGTDFEPVELAAAKALMKLKRQRKSPLALAAALLRGLTRPVAKPEVLERLGLTKPKTLSERFWRALVAGNL
ncbi:acetyl-CoA hydrolase/transferase C-terminal domain-containing protein [Niveibacterium terrae]|uniref:acetyl-CoA hydrolase/transferase C-terminal domain-containing protein n=1 Tax=Niveibacterium terrae TaxID=3373598 RepID=UPI003A91BCE5